MDYKLKTPHAFQFNLNGTPAYMGLIQLWDDYGSNRASSMALEMVVFNIPDLNQNSTTLIKDLEQFLTTFTGKDLFFHCPIKKNLIKNEDGRLEILFSTQGDLDILTPNTDSDEAFNLVSELTFHPNFYRDTYFYYTREDLDTIYKDVQTLINALDSRYG